MGNMSTFSNQREYSQILDGSTATHSLLTKKPFRPFELIGVIATVLRLESLEIPDIEEFDYHFHQIRKDVHLFLYVCGKQFKRCRCYVLLHSCNIFST